MNASTVDEGSGHDRSPAPLPPARPVADWGALFLRREQAAVLARLRRSEAGGGAGAAPADPDTHGRWLDLIAATAEQRGPAVARRVARLYEFHGRVIGSLTRERALPLDPSATARLHRLLGDRLSELTDDAVAAVSPRR